VSFITSFLSSFDYFFRSSAGMLLDVDAWLDGIGNATTFEVKKVCDGIGLVLCGYVVDGRELSFLVDIVGKVVAQVRRLVVGYILPADAHAINVVVHEGWYTD